MPPRPDDETPPRSLIPIPDPTLLTTAALTREVASLRELFAAKLETIEEKFKNIDAMFFERGARFDQNRVDNRVAVETALALAKEAVNEQNKTSAAALAKSEAATTKQIDQIETIVRTMASGLADKIDDLKQRITVMEGRAKGTEGTMGYVIGVIAIAISVASVAASWLHH